MPMSPKEMVKHLEANGFLKKECADGSHQKMYNPATKRTTVVPIPRRSWARDWNTRYLTKNRSRGVVLAFGR